MSELWTQEIIVNSILNHNNLVRISCLLWGHPYICTEGLLPLGLGNCTGLPHARQMPYPLYCMAQAPNKDHFKTGRGERAITQGKGTWYVAILGSVLVRGQSGSDSINEYFKNRDQRDPFGFICLLVPASIPMDFFWVCGKAEFVAVHFFALVLVLTWAYCCCIEHICVVIPFFPPHMPCLPTPTSPRPCLTILKDHVTYCVTDRWRRENNHQTLWEY